MASRAEARKHWSEILKQWRASGQSMAAFCRERGVDCRRLQRWGKRVGRPQGGKPLTLIPVLPRSVERMRPTVPVQLGDSAGAVAIRIRLPGEIAIEMAEGFDPKLLVDVVVLLRARAPC